MIADTVPTGGLTLRPVGTDLHLPVRVAQNTTDGTELSLRTRMTHTMERAADSIRFVYANWVNENGREAPGPSTITVSASVLTSDGAPIPATFGGAPTARLAPGQQVISDPVAVHALEESMITSSTLVEVNRRGERIPLGSQLPGAAESYGFAPRLILSESGVGDDRLLVAVIGDSNAVGFGDDGTGTLHHGWVRRACEPDTAHLNLGISGATARTSQSISALRHRFDLLRWVRPDRIISALGTNDVADPTAHIDEVSRDLRAHWSALQSLGVPVVACTVPPVTSGSGEQHPVGAEPTRIAINRWIRSRPDPLLDVIDLAAILEAPDRPGHWRTGFSDDGIHFSAQGHTEVARVVRSFLESMRSPHTHQYDDRRQNR